MSETASWRRWSRGRADHGRFSSILVIRGDEVGDLSVLLASTSSAICLATHLVIRIRTPHADPYLFPLAASLAAVGLVMIYRIDESLARDQATWFVAGLVAFAATVSFLRDYHVLERNRYLIAVTGLGLLLMPRLPLIGDQVNGAYLGVDLGPSSSSRQFAKVCVVVFLASDLREHREVLTVGARRIAGMTLPPLKHFGPLLVVWGVAMLMLIFIRDLGSSLMFFGAFLALLYVATARLSLSSSASGCSSLGRGSSPATVPHVGERIDIWLDPWTDSKDSGFQIVQSLFARQTAVFSVRGSAARFARASAARQHPAGGGH